MLWTDSLPHEVFHDCFGLPVAYVGNGGVHGAVLPIGGQQSSAQLQVRGQQGEEAQPSLAGNNFVVVVVVHIVVVIVEREVGRSMLLDLGKLGGGGV